MPRRRPEPKSQHPMLGRPVLSRRFISKTDTPASPYAIPLGRPVTLHIREGDEVRSHFGRRTEKGVMLTHRAIRPGTREPIHDRIEPREVRFGRGRQRNKALTNVTEIDFHPPEIVDSPASRERLQRDRMRGEGKTNPRSL